MARRFHASLQQKLVLCIGCDMLWTRYHLSGRHRVSKPYFLPHDHLPRLLDGLRAAGYGVVGPQCRDGAIVYASLDVATALPYGVSDRQQPGSYRLVSGHGSRAFSWANGPQALKPYLFSPQEVLWRVARSADGQLAFDAELPVPAPTAVIGVRACDLAALALQDQHFLHCSYPDPYYRQRRESLFIVAVHCGSPADTCFCASTGDGPRAEQGFDLALGELDDGFVCQAGSERGQVLLESLGLCVASTVQLSALDAELAQAAQQQRALPGRDLQQPLFANLQHPRWDELGNRCLSCGNCTSVCPTCFCHSEHDLAALDGASSERIRQWDSCFTQGHSYIHGITIRAETKFRYRQWLTHKLGSWHEQYGRSGCVGCGRCISWCPVGIDITDEAAAITAEGCP